MHFSGETYNHSRDAARLRAQYDAVFKIMRDGCWRTLQQLESLVGAPQASISARLRDMRKERFGAHTVHRRYLARGQYEYQLEENLF
jgi:hypothetical protein